MRIALLEDDQDQADIIAAWIREVEHDCSVFSTGKAFIRELNRETFDLLILDWMLPDTDGIEVLKWVRQKIQWPIPVLFVTAKDEEQDIILALDAGADDYMAKPIKKGELIARLNALSRRVHLQTQETGEIEFLPYIIKPAVKTILLNDEVIDLTLKEFELAYFLFRNVGRVLSRGHILETVWGASSDLNTRTVDTHISRIRTKLNLKPENGWILRSIYQHGYRLEKSEENP